MPREGYELLTVTREARVALEQAKEALGCTSLSETIVKMSQLAVAVATVLAPRTKQSNRKQRQRTRAEHESTKPISITVRLPEKG